VEEQEAAGAAGGDAAEGGSTGAGAPRTLAGIKAALTGVPTAVTVAAGGRAGIRTMTGPPRTKALRYTFNAGLRETRLAADLEDITDDEDEVRLADKIALDRGSTAGVALTGERAAAGGAGSAAADGEDEGEGEGEGDDVELPVESSGVKHASDKAVGKRENSSKRGDAFRDGCVGMYTSDPRLVNPKRQESHRKGKYKTAKASFRFWETS